MKTAKSPENLSIGERISIIRSQFCGNDNKKLAQLAGIDQSSTSKIISGTFKPSLKVIQNLLLNLPELSPDWLLYGKGDIQRGSVVVTNSPNYGNEQSIGNVTINPEITSLTQSLANVTEANKDNAVTIREQHATIDMLIQKLATHL